MNRIPYVILCSVYSTCRLPLLSTICLTSTRYDLKGSWVGQARGSPSALFTFYFGLTLPRVFDLAGAPTSGDIYITHIYIEHVRVNPNPLGVVLMPLRKPCMQQIHTCRDGGNTFTPERYRLELNSAHTFTGRQAPQRPTHSFWSFLLECARGVG